MLIYIKQWLSKQTKRSHFYSHRVGVQGLKVKSPSRWVFSEFSIIHKITPLKQHAPSAPSIKGFLLVRHSSYALWYLNITFAISINISYLKIKSVIFFMSLYIWMNEWILFYATSAKFQLNATRTSLYFLLTESHSISKANIKQSYVTGNENNEQFDKLYLVKKINSVS